MTEKSTLNHLIKYLYHETSAAERLEISEALSTDRHLREEYNGLRAAYRQLPKVTFSPSDSALKSIVGYSRSAALESHA